MRWTVENLKSKLIPGRPIALPEHDATVLCGAASKREAQ
jgi:hypothetical protein